MSVVSKEQGFLVSIQSKLLNLNTVKVVLFGEKVCAKIQFETFEGFSDRNDLSSITCITSDCSVGQLLVHVRRFEEDDQVRYLMWDSVQNKNDYHVSMSKLCFGSRRDSLSGAYTGHVVRFDRQKLVGYVGTSLNGDAHGFGRVTYYNLESKLISFDGQFKNRRKHGIGKSVYRNGDIYEGEWVDGLLCGEGVKHYSNGDVYTGGWNNNKKSGQGVMKYTNGNVYSGAWRKDLQDGKGELKTPDGNLYDGPWIKGKPDIKMVALGTHSKKKFVCWNGGFDLRI